MDRYELQSRSHNQEIRHSLFDERRSEYASERQGLLQKTTVINGQITDIDEKFHTLEKLSNSRFPRRFPVTISSVWTEEVDNGYFMHDRQKSSEIFNITTPNLEEACILALVKQVAPIVRRNWEAVEIGEKETYRVDSSPGLSEDITLTIQSIHGYEVSRLTTPNTFGLCATSIVNAYEQLNDSLQFVVKESNFVQELGPKIVVDERAAYESLLRQYVLRNTVAKIIESIV